MQGRGRGESRQVQIVDEVDPRIEEDRQRQLEAVRALGLHDGSVPVRGRGGFRNTDFSTMPANVTATRVTDNAYRRVDIVANYVPVVSMADREVQMYRVDYEPSVESASKMRFLFKKTSKGLFQRQPIFDGAHECRSGQKLKEKVTSVPVEDPQDSVKYTVKYTHTGSCLHGAEFLRIYNMHMKDFLRMLGFYSPQVGLFVNPNHYDQVGADLMMLRGFRTAAAMHDGNKMLMNLEASHKIVQRKNVLDILTELKNQNRSGANLREVLNSALVGKIVVTGYNKRCYRVEEVDVTRRPTDTFDRNGEQVSFVDFYRTVHSLQIQSLNQPMLRVVPNNQRRREGEEQNASVIMLVPELCNIAGLTDAQRNNPRLKMDLIRASQVPPSERVKQLRAFLQSFHANTDIREQLATWGYSYANEPCRLSAHTIQQTGYACGPDTRQPPNAWPRADVNSADIRVNALAVVPQIKKLVIITARNQLRDKGLLLMSLKRGFDSIKLVATEHATVDIAEGDSPNHYINAIRTLSPDTTVAIVIMQAQHKERYDAIKKAASVEKGLITQVVTAKLLLDEKKSRSACQKIGIQVAAKIGGEPWWVDIPLKKTMICGYDTYHDTARRGRSFGAFVASLNIHYSRWWSKANAHDRLDEISAHMSINIKEALKAYQKCNDGELPEQIIIYRDGVGEGQLEHVFRVEVDRIKEAIAEIGPIKLVMTVVNKRIGARFYMRSGNCETFSNPPPGTVIDHTVTRNGRYDFYLVSQSTRQGTVTPTYYNIIHDERGFKPEIHQKLAFKLCLLYYNWSGTVRVPAPCQYAHKLAYLCGEHLHSQPNSVMDDKLHFL